MIIREFNKVCYETINLMEEMDMSNKKIAENIFVNHLLGWPVSVWWQVELDIEERIIRKWRKKGRARGIIREFRKLTEH